MNDPALRRELRLHRLILGGTVALLAVLLLGGAAVPASLDLRARRLVLVDEGGAEVAVLEASAGVARLVQPAGGTARAIELSLAGEGPAVRLHDDQGATRVGLMCGREGSGVAVLDRDGHVRAELRSVRGTAEFFLRDPGGAVRVGAGATASGAAGILVFDGARQPLASLEVSQDRARLVLSDPRRVPRILLQAGNDGQSGLELRDAAGKPVWAQPAQPAGPGEP